MYVNPNTEKGVNKILKVVFILVAIGVIGALAKVVIDHLDPDTGGMTVTAADEDHSSCSDTAIKAMRENGLKVPVKCKQK